MKPIYNLTATKTPFLCNSVFTKIFLLERKKLKSLMWSNNATYHIYKQTSKNYIWVPTTHIILMNENKTKIQRLIFREISVTKFAYLQLFFNTFLQYYISYIIVAKVLLYIVGYIVFYILFNPFLIFKEMKGK